MAKKAKTRKPTLKPIVLGVNAPTPSATTAIPVIVAPTAPTRAIEPETGKLAPKVSDESEMIPVSLCNMQFDERLETLPIDEIKLDLVRNKRDESTAYDEKNPDMKRDLIGMRSSGIMPGKRPLVHRNTLALQGNTDVQMIHGHRRWHLCKICKFSHIPCVVITGATNEQINALIVDPPDVDGDKIGKLKSFILLRDAGITGTKTVCARCKIAETDLQEYRALARLPESYVDMWRSYQRNKKDKAVLFTPTRDASLALLKAQGEDQDGEKDASGAYIRAPHRAPEGPRYQALFAKLMSGGNPVPDKVNSKTLTEFADGFSHVPTVQSLVLGLANAEGVDRSAAVAEAVRVSVNYATLTALRDRLKDDYLTALIDGPPSANKIEHAARHEALAVLFVDAVRHFIGVDPSRDLLATWTAVAPTAVAPTAAAVAPTTRRKARSAK